MVDAFMEEKLMTYLKQLIELESQKYALNQIKEGLYVLYSKILGQKKVEYVSECKFREEYEKLKDTDAYFISGKILLGANIILFVIFAFNNSVLLAWLVTIGWLLALSRYFGVIIYTINKCRKDNEKKMLELEAKKRHNQNVDEIALKCEQKIMEIFIVYARYTNC